MKRILSLLICAMLIISSVGVVSFANENHWSYDYIKGMISDGIITGDQNGNLNLDNTITRAEFAKTVNKYFGYTTKATEGFKDVTADKWYYNDLLIAKGTGYMMGDTAGFANPDGKITRAEAFVIIARILNLNDDNTVSFTDSETIPLWAKGKIGALVKAGIVSGYTDGSINAKGNLTRAEAFVVISKNERPSIPDNSVNEAQGNTSSMVNNGGTTSSGGGGGGGGAPSGGTAVASATVAIKNIDVNTFDIALQAKNASSFTVKLESGTYSAEEALETVSQNGVFMGNIKPIIEKAIAVNTANYGKKAKISVKANGTVGVLSSGWVYYTKEIIIDKGIPAVENILLTIGDNEKYTLTFDEVSGAIGYKATVYADEGLTEEKSAFTASINEITIDLSDSSKFIEGKTYYITVSAKIGEYYGVKNSSVPSVIIGMGGGNGTASSPYLIYTKDQLMNISKAPDKAYKLMADITASTPITEPATKENVKFTGKLDGNGHSIYMDISYSVTVGSAVGTGLFCNVNGANFENLTLKGNLTGRSQLGGLVGYAEGATNFKNITNRANITSTGSGTSYYVGGIVGYHNGTGEITGCKNYGAMSSSNCMIGGIVGRNTANVPISRCANFGNLSNTGLVGGIIAQGYGSLTMCYNMGDVKGAYPAGIVARPYANPFKVSYSFNAGNIEKTSTVEPAAIAVSYETSASYKAQMTYCYNLVEGISLTSRYANNTASNCYTLSTTETMAGVTKLTKQELTVLDLGERFTLYEENLTNDDYNKNYYYPQLTKNLIPKDVSYEDEDMGMSVASVSYDAGILSFVIEKFPQIGTTKSVIVELIPLNEATDESTKATVNISDMSVLSYNVPVGIPESGCKAVKIIALSESGNYLGEAVMPISIGIFTGSGTEADPYIIDSGERFEAIFGENGVDIAKSHGNKNVYFLQTNDIALSDSFVPNYTNTFSGKYICGSISDGAITKSNKTITVNISSTNEKTALFPNATGSYISGITVCGSISGGKNTGAVIGTTSTATGFPQGNTVIENCINNANVSGVSHSGGIAGTLACTTMLNCVNNGKVTVSGQYAGGLVGWSNSATLIDGCSNNGAVTALSTYAGGIAGVTYNSKIVKTNNTGSVSGTSAVGGIAGQITTPGSTLTNVSYNTISECWNSGAVQSAIVAGGIAGEINLNYSNSKALIENCFNTGSVMSENGSSGSIAYRASAVKSGVTISGHSLTIKGYYDPYAVSDAITIIDSTIENELTASGVYVIGNTSTVYPSGTKEITKEELIALPGNDNDFSSDIWVIKEGYVLPQLKNNPYTGMDYVQPIDISYSFNPASGKYFVNWEASADAESYDVYVNGVKVNDTPVIGTTFDITGNIVNNQETVYVTINKEGKSYLSNKIAVLYGDGEGTKENPWRIYNINQLKNVKYNLDAHFVQVNDISDALTEPIGTAEKPFTGSYRSADNENKAVTLDIEGGTEYGCVAMFGVVQGGHIANISTYGSVVGGSKIDVVNGRNVNCVAGIVAHSASSDPKGSVTGCINYAEISRVSTTDAAYMGMGGISGYNVSLPIINCMNYGSVSDFYEANCAGIAGYVATEINGCKNYGTVSTNQTSTGGIGGACYAEIKNCANLGAISSTSTGTHPGVGGIAGTMGAGCNVYSSYNAGAITGKNRVGGIAGRVMEADKKTTHSYIENCFNTGLVSGTGADVASVVSYFYRGGALTIKNTFDTANPSLPLIANVTSITTGATVPVIENSYVLSSTSGTAITNGGTTISSSDLKNLLTDDTTYLSSVWCIKPSFEYPQLVSMPYEEQMTIKSFSFNGDDNTYALEMKTVASIKVKKYVVTFEAKSGEGDNTSVEFNGNSSIMTINPLEDMPATGVTNMIVEVYNQSDVVEARFVKELNLDYLVGDGTESNPYWVITLDNLYSVEDNNGKHFIQKKNIYGVTRILNFTDSKPFSGVYNGNGYEIDVDITSASSGKSCGLFNYMSGTVENVTVTGSIKTYITQTGAIVGTTKGTTFKIIGCVNKADITNEAKDCDQVAGIVGRAYGSTGVIKNCSNYGSITSKRASGIVGVIANSITIENCMNYGNITGKQSAGGITDWSYGNAVNCGNFGTITALDADGFVTGIMGRLQTNGTSYNSVITNCFNAGKLDAAFTFGIVARQLKGTGGGSTSKTGKFTVTGCYNLYKDADYPITAKAGVVNSDTSIFGAVTMTNCHYYGEADDEHTGSDKHSSLDDFKDNNLIEGLSVVNESAYPYIQSSENSVPSDYSYVNPDL